jgi:hypothetical protein
LKCLGVGVEIIEAVRAVSAPARAFALLVLESQPLPRPTEIVGSATHVDAAALGPARLKTLNTLLEIGDYILK